MYEWLLNNPKKRLIEELRDSFANHPFFEKIVEHIQDRHAFKERPQFGIIVKGVSGDQIKLSPSHFIGTVKSYCMQAHIDTYPGVFLEWTREDSLAIKNNDFNMPSPPGVYVVELTHVTEEIDGGTFIVTRIKSIPDEKIIEFETGLETEASLSEMPLDGSLRLINNNLYMLQEGVDYEVYGKNITFIEPFISGTSIFADYKVYLGTSDEYKFEAFTYNNTAIPGAMLAFGNALKKGDKCAIVISDKKVDAYELYGGHYTIHFDLDAIAKSDIKQAERIAALIVMYLNKKMLVLSNEGLTITQGPNISGESEEIYDESGDMYYYSSQVTFDLLTDWSYYKALPLTISQIVSNTTYESMNLGTFIETASKNTTNLNTELIH